MREMRSNKIQKKETRGGGAGRGGDTQLLLDFPCCWFNPKSWLKAYRHGILFLLVITKASQNNYPFFHFPFLHVSVLQQPPINRATRKTTRGKRKSIVHLTADKANLLDSCFPPQLKLSLILSCPGK